MSHLEELEAQGHGGAWLELSSMIPLTTRKITASVSEMVDRLERLELQGYGNALLELGPILLPQGEYHLSADGQLCQVVSYHHHPDHRKDCKRTGFHFSSVWNFFRKALPHPTEISLGNEPWESPNPNNESPAKKN